MSAIPEASRHTMFVLRPDPEVNDAALAAWIGAAVARGEKVLATHPPDGEDALRRLLARSGVGAAMTTGQVELADADTVRARHRSRPADFAALAARAIADGWQGLALTGQDSALPCLLSDPADPRRHEQDVERLTAEAPVRVLCRIPPDPDGVERLVRLHHRHLDDVMWSAREHDGRLWVAGDLDASNATRATAALCGAVEHGLTEIDVSGLRFCAVAGLRAFLAAAAAANGRTIHLTGAGTAIARLFGIAGAQHAGLRLTGGEADS